MTTMLKLVVIATLLLAAGSGAVPAGANEVIVPETVSFGGLPLDPKLDIFHVRCTQASNLMCVAMVNEDDLRVLYSTAVVSAPAGLAGDAWAERVAPLDFRVHCFKTQGDRKYLMQGYVTTGITHYHEPAHYALHAQCWSGSPSTGYTTRGTAVTTTQDQ